MLKGIVFDLDGTLVDSLNLTYDAFNRGITSQGGMLHTPQEISRYFGPGEIEIFSQIVGSERAQAAMNSFHTYFMENISQAPKHHGIDELLLSLAELKIPCAIFTGRGRVTTDMLLEFHQWKKSFAAVVTNDDVTEPKPSPEGLFIAAEQIGLKPQNVIYVGDSPVDILAARGASVLSAACFWDRNSQCAQHQERMQKHMPNFNLKQPSEIISVIKKINLMKAPPRYSALGSNSDQKTGS